MENEMKQKSVLPGLLAVCAIVVIFASLAGLALEAFVSDDAQCETLREENLNDYINRCSPANQPVQDNDPSLVAPTEGASSEPPSQDEIDAVSGNNPVPPELEKDPAAAAPTDQCPDLPLYQVPGADCDAVREEFTNAGITPDIMDRLIDWCPESLLTYRQGSSCPVPPQNP